MGGRSEELGGRGEESGARIEGRRGERGKTKRGSETSELLGCCDSDAAHPPANKFRRIRIKL